MLRRFALKKSAYGSHHQGSPFHLASDPDTNDKTRRSKIRFSITSWSLSFQRLLLNTHAKRDILLPISACLLLCFGIILYHLLHPNVVDRMTRRSISQQELHRYYSTTDHPILLRFDNPLNNLPQEVRQYHHNTRKNEGWTDNDEKRQQDLWSEEKYEDEEYLRPDPYEGMPECTPMHKWQTAQFPTCTIIHEQALDDDYFGKFIASGAFRQTFEIYDYETNSPVAMKTIRDRPKQNLFTPYYMERHRIDALIYERTSASPWITDMYGFCGYSGLFEFAGGGTLDDAILDREEKDLKPLSRLEKLSLAVEATSAIADLHTIDSINGYSAMIHGDIYVNQFVRIGSRYKLNDFNRGHLLYWDAKKRESCPYAWDDGHKGSFRAPEEYKVESFSEMVDVFSLGNIIFCIVVGRFPFDDRDIDEKIARKRIKNGKLPALKKEYRESDNSMDMALLKAMDMCFTYRWQDRARASEVRTVLLDELRNANENRHKAIHV